jgi:hypothetical protein
MGAITIIDLEPGNGTRYALALADTSAFLLVCWLSRSDIGGCAIRIPKDEHPDIAYIAEKMAIGIADAAAISAFVRQRFDVSIHIPPGFDQQTGLWIDSPSPHTH